MRTRKEQWLLALLLLHHDRPQERAWLAETLWPDSLRERALQNLRRSLNELRHVLGPDGVRLLSPTPRTLSFDVSGADIDVLRFDAAIRRGERVALEEAISLYRGPLLQGCSEDWLLPERSHREQSCLQALERLAQMASARKDYVGAIGYLRRILVQEPSRESALRALLEALASSGDQAAVTQAYRDFRLYLHEELNAQPDSETSALYRLLRAEAREKTQPLPRTVAATTPALRRLPSPPTTFIGREAEREQLISLLSTTRLLTLTGTGGVGKTRLAISVAAEIAEEYKDGVCFVDLAPLQDPTRVVLAVASALEVREEPNCPLLETLLDYLQPRSLLLILDNCEHLAEACASLSDALLGGNTHLHLLATSRQPLGIVGERTWRVPSLTLPEGNGQEWEEEKGAQAILMGSEAAQLFVERATAASADFRLARENLVSVAELCRVLDGIPLALELAAAWVRVMPVSQTLSRLRERLDLLHTRYQGTLPRHQTLQATLDWSYGLLEEREQRLLGRLSVFAGGWSLEAAEALCAEEGNGPDAVLMGLADLVDRSLVVYEEQEGTGRYRLLETTRQYAKEKLHGSGETDTMGGRHRDFFLHGLDGKLDHRDWDPVWDVNVQECAEEYQRWCAIERANCRAALRFSLDEPNGAKSAMRMAAQLWRFWHRHGYHTEGRSWVHAALEKDGGISFSHERLMAINVAGFLAEMQSDYEALRPLADEGIALARKFEPESVVHILDLVLATTSDWTLRPPIHEEQVALARRNGDLRLIAGALVDQARNLFHTQHESAVRPLLEEALDYATRYDDAHLLMNVEMMLSALLWWEGDYVGSRRLGQKVVEYQRKAGNPFGLGYQCVELAWADRRLGDFASMRSLYAEGIRAFQQMGHAKGIITALADIVGGEYAALGASDKMDAEWAARVLGAGDRHARLRDLDPSAYPYARLASNDPDLVPGLHATLGEQAFARACAEGAAMTIEEAVEYALQKQSDL
jgi:predicted ATPase/DNA-binding SARP family transcriptional activator